MYYDVLRRLRPKRESPGGPAQAAASAGWDHPETSPADNGDDDDDDDDNDDDDDDVDDDNDDDDVDDDDDDDDFE